MFRTRKHHSMITLCLFFVLFFGLFVSCSYAESEANLSYIIEYYYNTDLVRTPVYSTQIKYHDQSLILQKNFPSVDSKNFIGWSTKKSSTIPEFLPGDVYSDNASLKLYAVWDESYKMGTITSPYLFEHEALPVSENIWFSFRVSDTGYYHFYTSNNLKKYGESSSTGIYFRVEYEPYDFFKEIVRDIYSTTKDVDLIAQLESNKTYYLNIYVPKQSFLSLHCEKIGQTVDNNDDDEKTENNISETAGIVRILQDKNATIRSIASTKGDKLGIAEAGKKHELLEKTEKWYKIRLDDGQEGWIVSNMAEIVE